MCGRFTLITGPVGIQMAFPGVEVLENGYARYNIAPSQGVAVLRNTGANQVELLRWGLIPLWAEGPCHRQPADQRPGRDSGGETCLSRCFGGGAA